LHPTASKARGSSKWATLTGLTMARRRTLRRCRRDSDHPCRNFVARSRDRALSTRPVAGTAAISATHSNTLTALVCRTLAPSSHLSNRRTVPSPPPSKTLPGGMTAAARARTMLRSRSVSAGALALPGLECVTVLPESVATAAMTSVL
jgi:hypothetical protein